MIPDIIIRKISWYIWKNTVNKVNNEYKNRYKIIEDEEFEWSLGEINRTRNSVKIMYNWRNLSMIKSSALFNKRNKIVARLPKNYCLTMTKKYSIKID